MNLLARRWARRWQTVTVVVAMGAGGGACRGIIGVEDIPVLADAAGTDDASTLSDATIDAGPDGSGSIGPAEASLADQGSDAPSTSGDGGCSASAIMCGDSGACTDNDPKNCGACGNDCTTAMHVDSNATTCSSGTCHYACLSGYANCGDAGAGCPTALGAPTSCGSCTTTCPTNLPLCSAPAADAGVATCASSCTAPSPDLCGGACVNAQTDQDHCGVTCAACVNQTCVTGACTGTCAPGQTSCISGVPQTCGPTGAWVAGTVAVGQCSAVCTPTTTRCDTGGLQTCGSNGQWGATAACIGASSFCAGNACSSEPPSCQGGGVGAGPNCGGTAANVDCCASIELPASGLNVFDRDDETNYPATISAFRLDEFEVTVGRFRKFVAALGAGYTPPNGSGIHKHLNSGSGLVNSGGTGYESGWDAADWTSAALSGLATNPNGEFSPQTGATWTSTVGSNEKLPITDVTWYEAYAFCIWDGGFLPSEAEWNYAAEGGSDQNYYPWGAQASVHGSIGTYCNTSCDYPSGTTGSSCFGTLADIAPVGFYPTEDGRWGHADLAGNVWEWTLDWYVTPYSSATCADCADTTMPVAHPSRVLRGGSYDYPTADIVNSYRYPADPLNLAADSIGFRCARVP